MIYTWKLNFALLLSHCLVNLSTGNIDKVVSMLFSQHRWTCIGSTFLFNLIPTLKQHWVINIEITSTNIRRLKFHFQPNINVETTLMNVGDQRCFKVDVFAGKQFRILLENLKEMDNSSWDWCIKSHKHGQTPKYFP